MPEQYTDLTSDELKAWMDDGKEFVLIDVLGENSYSQKHLPGAKMADAHADDFVEQAEKLIASKETPVVVYCASFSCPLSPNAARKLSGAGYTNVYDYAGGLADWEEGGLPFEGMGSVAK